MPENREGEGEEEAWGCRGQLVPGRRTAWCWARGWSAIIVGGTVGPGAWTVGSVGYSRSPAPGLGVRKRRPKKQEEPEKQEEEKRG